MIEFWKLFSEELFNNLNLLRNGWFLRYYDKSKFTYHTINSIIPFVGKRLGLEIESELRLPDHSRIDFVYGRNIHNRFQINFAIEHENEWDSWYEELLKLSELNLDIKKVLISYYHWRDENIDCVKHNILYNCNPQRLNKDFLFIFGPGEFPKNDLGKKSVKDQDYKAFVFNGTKFEDLEDIPILRNLK